MASLLGLMTRPTQPPAGVLPAGSVPAQLIGATLDFLPMSSADIEKYELDSSFAEGEFVVPTVPPRGSLRTHYRVDQPVIVDKEGKKDTFVSILHTQELVNDLEGLKARQTVPMYEDIRIVDKFLAKFTKKLSIMGWLEKNENVFLEPDNHKAGKENSDFFSIPLLDKALSGLIPTGQKTMVIRQIISRQPPYWSLDNRPDRESYKERLGL